MKFNGERPIKFDPGCISYSYFPYLCRPKREIFSFKHFPQGSKSAPADRGRQQGVTHNKLYNAKG